MRRYGKLVALGGLAAASLLGCRSPDTASDDAYRRTRFVPLSAVSSLSVGPLFDRDPATSALVTRPVDVTLTFAADVDVREVRFVAGGGLIVTVPDASSLTSAAVGTSWQSVARRGTGLRRTLTVHLSPGGGPVSIGELEVWGLGAKVSPQGPAELAQLTSESPAVSFDNSFGVGGEPAQFSLAPPGAGTSPRCETVKFQVPSLVLASIRRAYVAFSADGVQRAVELVYAVNGGTPVGGNWIAGSPDPSTVFHELRPSSLVAETSVVVCVPEYATRSMTARKVRLLLFLDDGSMPFDRQTSDTLGEAADGQLGTATNFLAGRLELGLERPLQVDRIALRLASPTLSLQPSVQLHPSGEWQAGPSMALTRGWNEVATPGTAISRLAIALAGPARSDVPAASISELLVQGSPVAGSTPGPSLVISYPPLAARGGKLVGERFSEHAFVAGWAESPSGPGRVSVQGTDVGYSDGNYSTRVYRAPGTAPTDSWPVVVTAVFPDGSTLTRTIYLDDDATLQNGGAGSSAGGATADARYGRLRQSSWGNIEPGIGGRVLLGTDVAFDAPPGAVSARTRVGISREQAEVVPPLDPGMVNVTAPAGGGYRFLPPGQVFKSAVRVTLPYAPELIPEGMTAASILTYYFDKEQQHWVPLPRKLIAHAKQQITSETTHFTFMVNAVLVLPDHPTPASFNPTSLKDLKAAEPAAGIDFIEPPTPSSMGSAQLGFPIRLPPARGAYAPQVSLSYDSSRGNGWVGMGWDVSVSSITIDTRWGVPYYDAADPFFASDRYLLDGQQLVPASEPTTCVDGTNGKRFRARVERAFQHIVRCGTLPHNYRWEVTDKAGTLFLYGLTPLARLSNYGGGREAAEWHLERVVDANGNLTYFRYETDSLAEGGSDSFLAANNEDFQKLYLKEIHYSGRAARTGSDAVSQAEPAAAQLGIYAVIFHRRTANGDREERGDVITSARTGFKVLTRHRLGSIEVRIDSPATSVSQADSRIIREYQLAYALGDFDKSLLSSVTVFGSGGISGNLSFYSHQFGYSRSAVPGSSAPRFQSWTADLTPGDGRSIANRHESHWGTHAYTGIAAGPAKDTGSVGFSVNTNFRDSTTHSALLDINGDGLPDRLDVQTNGNLLVAMGDAPNRRFFTDAGAYDPSPDTAWNHHLQPFPIAGLGKENGYSLGVGVEAHFVGFQATANATYSVSKANQFLIDAEGDGLPDLVDRNSVYFNRPRGNDGGQCSPTRFCFEQDAYRRQAVLAGFDGLDGGGATAARDALAAYSRPEDTVVEWTASHTGTVNVSGNLAMVYPAPDGGVRDGVRLRVYHHRVGDPPSTELLPTTSTAVNLTNHSVEAHDRLYFVLSTLADFPVDPLPDGGRPAELVTFAPTIQYADCPEGLCDPTIRDGAGSPVYRFDMSDDFRLAGRPMTVNIAADGQVQVTSTFHKRRVTSADVRFCILVEGPGHAPPTRCRTPGFFDTSVLVTAHASSVGDFPFNPTFGMKAGDTLTFIIDSEVDVDAADIGWTPVVVRQTVPGQSAPVETSLEVHYLALNHAESTPIVPFFVPHAGEMTFTSSGSASALDVFCNTINYYIRTPGRLLRKYQPGLFDDTTLKLTVAEGEEVIAEAHGECQIAPGSFRVTGKLFTPLPDGGVQQQTFTIPVNTTWEKGTDAQRASLFGGGFHRWRFGVWKGRDGQNEDFDPSLFYVPTGTMGINPDDPPAKQYRDAKALLRDPQSELYRHTQLFSALAPSTTGANRPNSSLVLYAGPAYVSSDGLAFATGTQLHAARENGPTSGSGEQPVSFGLGSLGRLSSSLSFGGGLAIPFFLNGNVSFALSSQDVDVRDMNGDGIIDVVVSGEANRGVAVLADRATLNPAWFLEAPTTGLHSSDTAELGYGTGLGASAPLTTRRANNQNTGTVAQYPTTFLFGGGMAYTMSTAKSELVDVNGDGLPDQTRMDTATERLFVRLNLGTKFADQEDSLSVPPWNVGAGFDSIVSNVYDLVTGSGNRPADPDEAQTYDEVNSHRGVFKTSTVLRRASTVTLQGNVGFVGGSEEWGVSLNADTSITQTEMMLADVTGDGLPDFVRKVTGDKFRVRVNLGYGFGPEEQWTAPAWPSTAKLPRLRNPNPLYEATLSSIGIGGGGVDSLEASGVATSVGGGGVYTLPLPLGPLTPWLLDSVGANVNPVRLSGFELGLMDIDGDGFADQVMKTQELLPQITKAFGFPPAQEKVYARINQGAGGNLLQSVSQPLGGSLQLVYARSPNTTEMPHSQQLLTSYTVDDGLVSASGPGHRLTTTLAYERGRYERYDREPLGFRQVVSRNPDGSQTRRLFNNDRYLTRGLLEQETLTDVAGKLFVTTVNAYDDTAPRVFGSVDLACVATTPFFLDPSEFCRSQYVPLRSIERRHNEGQPSPGIVSRQTFDYDALGNVTDYVDEADVADTSDDLLASIEYVTNRAAVDVRASGLPMHVSVRDRSGNVLRERWAEYDLLGNLTKFRVAVGTTSQAVTDLEWDPEGTLRSVLGPTNDSTQRYRLTYEYRDGSGSHPTRITDSFGYSSTNIFDLATGEPKSTTDVAGNTTLRGFDLFSRLSEVRAPGDLTALRATVKILYAHDASRPYAKTTNKLQAGAGTALDVVVFQDGFRRVIQTKKQAAVRGVPAVTVSGLIGFDNKGRAIGVSQPALSTTAPEVFVANQAELNPTRYAFDVLDRKVRIETPDSPTEAMTRISYGFGIPTGGVRKQFQATTTDPKGNVRIVYQDARDRAVAVEERIGGRAPTTRYSYNQVGDVETIVDAEGHATTATYDLLGRRTSLTNPDTGRVDYVYDLAGNLIQKIDAKLAADGKAINYEYDFNRLAKVDYPNADSKDSVFTYGPPGATDNSAGRVVSIVDEAGEETRAYGQLGEVTRLTRIIGALPGKPVEPFTALFEYDAFGRMLRLTYPNGEVLSYTYDEGGLLKSATGVVVDDAGNSVFHTYVTGLQYDEFGQRVGVQYGNGVTTSYSYDVLTRRLKTLTTKTPDSTGAQALQAMTYGYDRVGNVTCITNALGASTATREGAVTFTYGYDEIYRLKTATGDADAAPNVMDSFTSSFEYSDIHNMTKKVQTRTVTGEPASNLTSTNHDWTYAYDVAKPHQATRIGNSIFTYDFNGNVLRQCVPGFAKCPGTKPPEPIDDRTPKDRSFVWTEENRLREVNDQGSGAIRFLYDSAGQRVAKLGGGNASSFYVGQWYTNVGGQLATNHVFAGEQRIASRVSDARAGLGAALPPGVVGNVHGCEPSDDQPQKCPPVVGWPGNWGGGSGGGGKITAATFFYHSDHLGSTSWLTNQVGGVHEHVEYFPYGELWREASQANGQGNGNGNGNQNKQPPRFLFTGKEYDTETRLTYFGARYYDSRTARWISTDADEGARTGKRAGKHLSLYSYAFQNPLTLIDPDGNDPVQIRILEDHRNGQVPIEYVRRAGLEQYTSDSRMEQWAESNQRRESHLAAQQVATADTMETLAVVEVGLLAASLTNPLTVANGLFTVGAQVAASSSTATAELGQWASVTETMSARAAAYQASIGGRAGQAYMVKGVKFDAFADGVLLEAKGPGYATFVRKGMFQSWWQGADDLVSQAQRQLNAAGGAPLRWHFAEEAAANATRTLFQERGVSGIDIVVTPP